MRFSYNRCPGCMAMVMDPNEDCGLCTKKHPPIGFENLARGPQRTVWQRLAGRFWLKVALLSTDLAEGPSRMSPDRLQ